MKDKRYLGINVLEAARQRVAWTFDTFPKIYVSFSGGKDSTVMLHLVAEEAKKRNRRVGVLFIDWEAQYKLTVQFVAEMLELYNEWLDPYWVALPFLTTNACSQFEPEWICWEPGREQDWVRPLPEGAISAQDFFPFYKCPMTFEAFLPEFGKWYAQGKLCGCLVGIRAGESLNRWRTVAGHGRKWDHDDDGARLQWTNYIERTLWNVYPIYDWKTSDIWAFHGKTGLPHNALYDRMHQAGVPLHNMRICEPYGDEQRRGLWLYHIIEPETWGRVVARVAGANNGALYSGESGNVMGNLRISKPEGHTWQSFAKMLLNSMPAKTSDHYKDKIAVWIHWYQARRFVIADELPKDTGSEDMPSWRRVCKMLLKNDYWCKTLSFSVTKAESYTRYKRIMQKRRAAWNLFPSRG